MTGKLKQRECPGCFFFRWRPLASCASLDASASCETEQLFKVWFSGVPTKIPNQCILHNSTRFVCSYIPNSDIRLVFIVVNKPKHYFLLQTLTNARRKERSRNKKRSNKVRHKDSGRSKNNGGKRTSKDRKNTTRRFLKMQPTGVRKNTLNSEKHRKWNDKMETAENEKSTLASHAANQ